MERSSIQLLHKRGRSQRQIAQELGHSRRTVARALREPVERAPAHRKRASIVDPYREQIGRWLGEGLSAALMLELARTDPDQPYEGGQSVFREAVRRERLRRRQAVADVPVRFEGLAGEYLQVDWGEIRRFPFTQAPPGTRYFLACRLKFSRWTWVWFTTTMRQETLLRGLVACFCALGFVPWVLVFARPDIHRCPAALPIAYVQPQMQIATLPSPSAQRVVKLAHAGHPPFAPLSAFTAADYPTAGSVTGLPIQSFTSAAGLLVNRRLQPCSESNSTAAFISRAIDTPPLACLNGA